MGHFPEEVGAGVEGRQIRGGDEWLEVGIYDGEFVGTGNWKVPRTRRLESLRYGRASFITRFGGMDYGVARQRGAVGIGIGAQRRRYTRGFFGAAVAEAIAIAVH